jgi:hypothetical protein
LKTQDARPESLTGLPVARIEVVASLEAGDFSGLIGRGCFRLMNVNVRADHGARPRFRNIPGTGLAKPAAKLLWLGEIFVRAIVEMENGHGRGTDGR